MSDIYFDIIRRANSTAYVYGDLVAPATPDDHVYECTDPGTTGGSPPVFNTSPTGATTVDGGVIWTERNPVGIIFAGALTFTSQPKYGDYRRTRKYFQPVNFSAGGDPYVYDKGLAARNNRSLTFTEMLSANLTSLLNFIEIVRGAKFAFNFYDEAGSAHKSIILNPDDIASAAERYGVENGPTLELYLYD